MSLQLFKICWLNQACFKMIGTHMIKYLRYRSFVAGELQRAERTIEAAKTLRVLA